MRLIFISVLVSAFLGLGCATIPSPSHLNFSDVCDGRSLASPAINAAIAAAHAQGGGTVSLPAGRYRCYSIHLMSNVSLVLENGCTLVAAVPTQREAYDLAEPCSWDVYQDFGHSHWHNSLIWGENLTNVAILGPGCIDGTALHDGHTEGEERRSTSSPTARLIDPRDTISPTPREGNGAPRPSSRPSRSDHLPSNVGNKAIALKNCRNVCLRDFSILRGGHFGILATGVDNFTIDGLTIDTNRDGMDIDCCQNVHVSNCSVNSPNDDGICLKSSYGLGYRRSTDNVTITNCYVTGGYRIGSLLDGTWQRFDYLKSQGHTGRIKFGTESNGGFRHIAVSNCVFDYCSGLAIESEDGAIVEDVAISNLVMSDIVNSPIFLRLGDRARGPGSPPPGVMRRISINNVVASNCNWRYGSIISGVPRHPIEDVSISNVRFTQQGGGRAEEEALQPPEREKAYPDPNMFGTMPSYGFFIRHGKNIRISDADIALATPDARPLIQLEDVQGFTAEHVNSNSAQTPRGYVIRDSSAIHLQDSPGSVEQNPATAATTQP